MASHGNAPSELVVDSALDAIPDRARERGEGGAEVAEIDNRGSAGLDPRSPRSGSSSGSDQSIPGHLGKPRKKWTMGMLNDRETDEVPGM